MFTRIAVLIFATAPNPHALVDSAIAAMQRGAALAAVRQVRLTGMDHIWMLGNAERAEGPWRVSYSQFVELYDAKLDRFRRTERPALPSGEQGPERTTILTDSVAGAFGGGRLITGSHGLFEDLIDRVDGSPMRALQLAAVSPALAYDGSVKRFDVIHDVVSFPWRNGRMRLELSRVTHLPNAIVIARTYPDNFRWAPFGDVVMRTDNVDWEITRSGAYWPMQQKISLNGEPLRDVNYAEASLESAPIAADSFAFPDSARVAYASASALNFSRFQFGARGQPSEVAPDVVRVPDFWAQTLVRQPDGVVIFEAHISAAYLHQLIDWAHQRWPAAPIKALVMTSDPWAHLGGFREAVALGIPIYVDAKSIPFLTRVARAPHTLEPDALARAYRAPKFISVTEKVAVGTGANRFTLYPTGGPYAERMLVAYFPEHKLLYGADLVFFKSGRDPSKGFLETEAEDLRRAVAREHLDVETLICVQNYPAPIAWKEFGIARVAFRQ